MGLDCSHDAWHGAYSAFDRWRKHVAKLAGIPLPLMEGYWRKISGIHDSDSLLMWQIKEIEEYLPLKWGAYTKHPLYPLLDHSDCDGYLTPGQCKKVAAGLEAVLLDPRADANLSGHIGNFRDKTQQFIDGCRLAHSRQERLEFR